MKILIVSLYYEPLNNIATTRLKAFYKYLTEFNHQVTVLTRHYSKNHLTTSNLNIGMTDGDDFEGDYYKKNDIIYTKFKTSNAKKDFSDKLPKGIKGLYNLTQLDVFHFSFVEYGLIAFKKELSNKNYDLIIASSPPPAVLLLAKQLHLKYNIPWVVDFRDSYITEEDKGVIKKIKEKVLNKHLKSCLGITFVSEGMKRFNNQLLNQKIKNIPQQIIYNGFSAVDELIDEQIIEKVKSLKASNQKLLVYTGSLYKHLNLDFFLNAVSHFNRLNLVFVLVGIQHSFKKEIKNNFNHLNIIFIDKVNVATSQQIQKMADFLLLNIWKNRYTGFSGKVFEYLNAEKIILIDNNPPDDLKEFLKPYKNIIYCNEDYSLFKSAIDSNLTPTLLTKNQKIELSRKQQVKNLELFIKDIIK